MEKKIKNGSKIVIKIKDNVFNNRVKNYNFNKLITTVNNMDIKSDCIDWSEISMQMKINTNQTFDDSQCMTLMNDLVSTYVKVMTFSDSYLTACRLWPLFPDVHVFDFKPFVTENTYNRIKRFRLKLVLSVPKGRDLEESVHRVHPKSYQPKPMNSKIFNFCQNEHKVNLIRSLTREEKLKLRSTLVTTIADFISGPNLDWDAVSKTMHSKGFKLLNVFDFQSIFTDIISNFLSFLNELDARRISREELPSFRLLYSIDLKSLLKSETYDKLSTLKTRLIAKRDQLLIDNFYNKFFHNIVLNIEHMSEHDLDFITTFAFIGESEQINRLFITIITESMTFGDIEWTEVSKGLNASKIFNDIQSEDISPEECQKYFKQLIARYVLVLTVSDSQSMASKMWSFFPIIHSIDLNPFLYWIIAENISILKDRFTIKDQEMGS